MLRQKCDRTFKTKNKTKKAMLELSISSFLWFLAMHTVTLTVPDETLQALQTTPENLSQEMLLVVAVKLYELGRLSSGAAANMAGIPRTVFLMKLADYGVDTFRLTEDELAEDIANA